MQEVEISLNEETEPPGYESIPILTEKTTEPNQRLQTTRFTVPMNSIAQGPRV
jgi:hypothetical protein